MLNFQAPAVAGRWTWPLALLVAAVAWLMPALAAAQGSSDDKLPQPKDVTIPSFFSGQNGPVINLRGTYYASKKGKEAVPVVLLPGFESTRGEMAELALKLQKAGHAALAVDLRGQGDSTKVVGMEMPFKIDDLNRRHLESMSQFDLEAIKQWLLVKHNAGELNVEQLVLVAADASTVPAINWSVIDWAWPVLADGTKQGQDVKALVLLTPTYNYKGANITAALRTPVLQQTLSLLIAVGSRDASSLREAKKMHSYLARVRPKPETQEDIIKYQNIFIQEVDTAFQGSKLLAPEFGIDDRIVKFIELRILSQDYSWQPRTKPFE